MDLYSLLREFADSWVLLFLTLVFVAVIAWTLRPGSRAVHDDIANSIFRNEKQPAAGGADMAPGTRPAKEA